ncbi:glycosyltransferase [Sphingomonas sp. CROZ-RG-20F-R02-07]|uniref:glycosyltransferase n=1 Tax=Sphingomonas sp. CROZ-RG-20F-R02-07 TaxID=2914832 RepID=UPI001F59DA01|nr:glycosyltransferase [Sphingomonas sp. CROZ-RG-20F-R02-07]
MSYDGMLEPLGQGQVIAYLERLADEFRIHLISFEKPVDLARGPSLRALEARLAAVGIVWHRRRYHKRPRFVSTIWDMACATLVAVAIARRERIAVLHARSVLSAAMLYPARLLARARFIVDIRGFWVDERVDGHQIKAGGVIYRLLKHMENAMLGAADRIVALTEASARVLRDDPRFGRPAAPIAVIPTCADLNAFTPAVQPPHGFVVGYVGQIGGWYRFDRMVELFAEFRRVRPDATMLVINRKNHDEMHRIFASYGIPPDAYAVRGAELAEVPAEVRRMTVALSINAVNFANAARAPTKLAEYLGCGVPCISSEGVGDVEAILEGERVGVVIRDFSEKGKHAAVAQMLALLDDPGLPDRCVAAARRRFALIDGVASYRRLYHELSGEVA